MEPQRCNHHFLIGDIDVQALRFLFVGLLALLLDGFVAFRLFVVYWLSSDLLSGLDVWSYLGFLWRLALGACLED